MSTVSEDETRKVNENQKTLLEYSDELEKQLKVLSIKPFKFSQFTNIQTIGHGGSTIVYSAIFEDQKYALKSIKNSLHLDNKSFKNFIQDIEHLRNINHPNIIKLFGTSRDPQTGNFMIVLQFAKDTDLRNYLGKKQKKGLYEISWTELIKLANGITHGLKYLHDKKIIHRDLGKREKIIENTPEEYASLYSKCWSSNLTDRPTPDEILNELEKLLTGVSVESITNNLVTHNYLYEETENYKVNNKFKEYYLLIEKIINDSMINFFDYDEFINFEKICENGHEKIQKAYWKSRELTVTLHNIKIGLNINKEIIQEYIKKV
ncbi:25138_t:CDS:2 [Dentiscutata erythropus]|uniref:25138_t:CDS:1 n=1 Tax=Dentiscutata erythropus TaxID=1348616 RepID=A0A9N8WRM6_9GLOM|nr:25138_t:CDS:2 [Dentiscutata erythropus]